MKNRTVLVLTKALIIIAVLALAVGTFATTVNAQVMSGPPNHTHHFSPATAPCWGTTCYGKDPYALGCANSIHEIKANVFFNSTVIGTVWNDYSYTCNANWAQGQVSSQKFGVDPFTVSITNQDSPPQKQCYPNSCPVYVGGYGGNAIAWTNMVDGSTLATAEVYGVCQDCEPDPPYDAKISQ